jgi:hypothetical protein
MIILVCQRNQTLGSSNRPRKDSTKQLVLDVWNFKFDDSTHVLVRIYTIGLESLLTWHGTNKNSTCSSRSLSESELGPVWNVGIFFLLLCFFLWNWIDSSEIAVKLLYSKQTLNKKEKLIGKSHGIGNWLSHVTDQYTSIYNVYCSNDLFDAG